jgi:hypothetical protein
MCSVVAGCWIAKQKHESIDQDLKAHKSCFTNFEHKGPSAEKCDTEHLTLVCHNVPCPPLNPKDLYSGPYPFSHFMF